MTLRPLPHPALEDIRLEAVLHALSDPVRLQIAWMLDAGHSDLACIAFDLPVSKSTTTYHFRVLREAGVIRQHYEGTSKLSNLRRPELEILFPGVLASILRAARPSAT